MPRSLAMSLALGTAPSAFGAAEIEEIHAAEFADLDVRTATVDPTAAQLAAVEELGATALWNEFGTPQSLIKHGGYLATGIEAADAVSAARAWVDANKALFRLSSTDGLAVVRDTDFAGTDGHAVLFAQQYDGLRAGPDGVLTVAVTGTAEAGWKVAYASSTLTGDETLASTAELSSVEAWVGAANAVGEDVSVLDVTDRERRAGWTDLDVAGLTGAQLVRRVAFPTPATGVRAAFETYVSDSDADGELTGYRQFVDAETGQILFRESAVDQLAADPRWLVFPSYPHLGLDYFPWNYPSADTRDLWCWFGNGNLEASSGGGRLCQYVIRNKASRVEWDRDARTQLPTFTTVGNNARSGENWGNSFFPMATQYRPVSPTRDYVYPWTNVWFETLCNEGNFVPGVGNDIDAATVNLFKGHNRMHDWSYWLGFREDTWNAQDFNFGIRPEGENDPIIGNVQAGAVVGGYPTYSGRDNANMFTRPDGQASWSNMYLWQPLAGAFYAPCVDGDYDMGVIAHEYGHMIENRMIGKGNRRAGFHAGAMGESHSDLVAMEYLNEYNFVPASGGDHPFTDDSHTTAIGPYVTANDERGIRNYNMAFPTSGGEWPLPGKYPFVNPLNFSDIGYDLTGPQVHADGEIWTATNFDIRELLNDRYPYIGQEIQRECADGLRPVYDCPGNRRWIQIVFDSFLLMTPRPSFIEARDAQLAADLIRFGGANQDLLWLAFARRGFGQNAFNRNEEDRQPIPDFESPLHEEETIVFNAVAKDEGGHPVDARIYVGHYEGRVSPIADTDPATVGQPNWDNVARFVPDDSARTNSHHRAYEFIAHAPGYGHVRFRVTEMKPGETRVVTILFPTNWGSRFKGAVATGDGVRHDNLIDDTEGTNWESTGRPVRGQQVLVQLPGAQRFEVVKVSAALVPETRPDETVRSTQNRFTALREFEIYACTVNEDRQNPTCDPTKLGPGGSTSPTQDQPPLGFKPVVNSQWDAFPGVTPRPVAPELNLRTWEAPTTVATHVLFRVIDNQCTGQPRFQGEQDLSVPNTSTDCRIGVPGVLPSRANEVRAAELQLLSSRPQVINAVAEE